MPLSTPLVVDSPNGELHFSLAQADGRVRCTLQSVGGVVLAAELKVAFDQADFSSIANAVVESEAVVSERSFAVPHGKRRAGSAPCVEQTVTITNEAGQHVAIDIVMFDDGAACRFRTVDEGSENWELLGDSSSFIFDPAGTKYVQGYDEVGLVKPASEAVYEALPIGTQFPVLPGWSFPALFRSGENWTLLTEAGVDGHNVGSHLVNGLRPGEYVMAGPPSNEGDGPATPGPAAPWALPWKLMITGTEAGDVVTSDMVALINEPTTMTNLDWVRPGRVSWSWWSDSHSPTNPEALRNFIDLAAEMGWEYSLIDANWNKMPEGTIESLVAYATERNVGLFLWYNSGGSHNMMTEQPRDKMRDRDTRRAEMQWLRDTGIVGLKVDFFQSDKASMNELAIDMLRDAADFELLMNFHGITAPKGWHITWPHLMTTEAVRGGEQYKFDDQFPVAAARHHTILAFTRNAIGPMDYTPITLSDVDFPHLTTNAHELALGVLFESSLQHPADKPEAYLSLPDAAQRYLRELPVVWDEVVILDGEPASHVVMARRFEDRWWIAGINGTHEPMEITVDLGAGQIISDGADPRALAITDWPGGPHTLTMAPRGGFLAFP